MTAADLAAGTPIVTMEGISIEFPGVKALDSVDFRLFPGEVHALMGENGAGKSTLIKALTGVYTIDSGTVTVDGQVRHITGPASAREVGISTVYQEVNLCPNLSVAENVLLGPKRGFGIRWGWMQREARRHLRDMGLDIDPQSLLGSHSLAIQQLVAIARAIAVDCKVLVLDEPTSSLDPDEVVQLFRVMRDLRERGVAILFVSHFIDQVYEISDRMTILRNGQLVGEYLTKELSQKDLVSKMIGRSMETLGSLRGKLRDGADEQGRPFVRAIGLGRRGSVQPYDLDVYPGEVVGLAGLLGSGRSELARLLCGADSPDHGELQVQGAPTRFRSPRSALLRDVAFSSEDRKAEGIIGDLTVRENIMLAIQAERGWLRRVPDAQVDELVERYMTALNIRPANPHMLIRNLSGGNQQKVLLARWLATQPKLLILDEPTRGIDVGAKAEIQKLVADLAEQGLSVVFISAELEEVLRLSHRVAVMRDKRKIGELENHGELSVSDIVDFIATGEKMPA